MKEKWKNIKGWGGLYQISNLGRVKSIQRYVNHPIAPRKIVRERVLKTGLMSAGYPGVSLSDADKKISCLVHVLVARHFVANRKKLSEVNHKDGNKQNNKSSNLEWVSSSGNAIHAYKIGLRRRRPPPSKKELNRIKFGMVPCPTTLIDLKQNKVLKYASVSSAANDIGVSQSTISKAKSRGHLIKNKRYKIV